MSGVAWEIGPNQVTPLGPGLDDGAVRAGATPLAGAARRLPGDIVVAVAPAATGDAHDRYAGHEDVGIHAEQRFGHDSSR